MRAQDLVANLLFWGGGAAGAAYLVAVRGVSLLLAVPLGFVGSAVVAFGASYLLGRRAR